MKNSTPDSSPEPQTASTQQNSTKTLSPQLAANSIQNPQLPISKGLGKKILAFGSVFAVFAAVIGLVADLSQIGDFALGFCRDQNDVPVVRSLCGERKDSVPEREVAERLPKFIPSQPSEQLQPKFKRAN